MTGKLRGIPYCPEAAIAAAAGRAGEEENASSSCPAASQVGIAAVAAGTGPSPYNIQGKVFLSGPYKGAPLSLAVVTPATAGPFDLGTVVVRVALFVDPETAQIRALSDPIPNVFGGAQLSIRSVDLRMNRPNFTLNPTSCEASATAGALNGGGADPADPAAFSSFAVSAPFQTSDCGALKFRPKLFTKLIGGRKKMRRNGHPAFRATLVARAGDANIKRAALTLPHSQFLDQSHIGTICTRVQLAAAACPARSVYGYARAESPLLDDQVAGPVYLVSSDNELPDLLADLKGQVNVRLRGVISSSKRRMKTVFSSVPDVPVSKFVLNMKGGRQRPTGQLARPLQRAQPLVPQLQSPERQEAEGEEAAAADPGLQEGRKTEEQVVRFRAVGLFSRGEELGRRGAMQRGIATGFVLAALSLLALAPAAAADTGDIIAPQNNPPSAQDGWQAGTCTTDLPECTPQTPGQFFTQAAGHPNVGLTQFIVKNKPFELIPGVPIPGTQNPVGSSRPCGSTSRRPQRQPPGDAAVRAGELPGRTVRGQRAGLAGRHQRGDRLAGRPPGPRARRSHQSAGLQPGAEGRPAGPLRLPHPQRAKSSSKPTSTGPATTTRGSRSLSPNRRSASC